MNIYRVLLWSVGLMAVVIAQASQPSPSPAGKKGAKGQPNPGVTEEGVWYVDDEQIFANLMDKLADIAEKGGGLSSKQLKATLKEGPATLRMVTGGDKPLTAEEVYQAALPSVMVLGSVIREGQEWIDGRYATAWVISSDGILVTNWHVFEAVEEGEVFGAADYRGVVYPVVEFLGGSQSMDVAIVRVDARGLRPLPLARRPESVAAWIAVLSHPGDQFYLFTQGHVSRYSQNLRDDGQLERWLNLTADYGAGSSGAPVLNRFGVVVGMAAMTVSVDSPDEPMPELKPMPPAKTRSRSQGPRGPFLRQRTTRADEKKPPVRPEEQAPAASNQQMVVKLAVPATEIRKLIREDPSR